MNSEYSVIITIATDSFACKNMPHAWYRLKKQHHDDLRTKEETIQGLTERL